MPQRHTPLLLLFILFACVEDVKEEVPASRIRFFALGDWGRDGTNNQKELADAMEELAAQKPPNFLVALGDNFYPDGVSSVNDPQWKTSFEDVYTGLHLQVPWYVALGNHDYGKDPKAEIDYTRVSKRWKMPDYFYTKLLRMRDGGSVRLVVLDTSPFEKSYYASTSFRRKFVKDTVRQKVWMDSVFSLQDADWTIVTGHHPLYTGGARVNDVNSVRSSLLPLFNKYKVDAYFAGHEHDLQHLKNPDAPTHHFVSGAGSELRPTGSMTYTRFSASIQGIMSVEVTRTTMDVYVISYKKDTLYRTQLMR